jgi:hypothetical protein
MGKVLTFSLFRRTDCKSALAGLDEDDRVHPLLNGRETYAIGKNGTDPDKYRAGIIYVGLGPLKIGKDSEANRHALQNKLAHDGLMHGESPYFRVLPNRKPKWFWYFGTGSGNTLW